jgi:hypothetical protein
MVLADKTPGPGLAGAEEQEIIRPNRKIAAHRRNRFLGVFNGLFFIFFIINHIMAIPVRESWGVLCQPD